MSLINSFPAEVVEDKECLEQSFLAFLRELDYPDDAFFRGPTFNLPRPGGKGKFISGLLGRRPGGKHDTDPLPCYADLAILDLESCQYLCLVEFRRQLDEEIERRLAAIFQSIFDCTGTRPPVFLVVPGVNSGFRIFQLRDDLNWLELPQRQFPRYPTLAAGLAAENSLAETFRRKKYLDRFSVTCNVLAAIITLIVLANVIGIGVLTSLQITLLVLAAALVVVPHAAAFGIVSPANKPKLLKFK